MNANGMANFPSGGTSAKNNKQRITESGDTVLPRSNRQVVNTSVGLYNQAIWNVSYFMIWRVLL